MKHLTASVIILSFSMLACQKKEGAGEDSQVLGYWDLEGSHLEAEHILFPNQPTVAELEDYINDANEKRNDPYISDLALAENISAISECFKIDKWVYAALIRKESTFDRTRTSNTGAKGFSQFTNIGIAEINHQLGYHNGSTDRSRVPKKNIAIFREFLDSCTIPLGTIDYQGFIEGHTHSWQRKNIASYNALSLAFGAMLLKIHLARNQGGYARALESYNGDNAVNNKGEITKIAYRKKILSWAKIASEDSTAVTAVSFK